MISNPSETVDSHNKFDSLLTDANPFDEFIRLLQLIGFKLGPIDCIVIVTDKIQIVHLKRFAAVGSIAIGLQTPVKYPLHA